MLVWTWTQHRYKDGLSRYGISIITMRWPWERLIFMMGILLLVMPQSHQTTSPYDFHHPYDFLPVRLSEASVGILRIGAVPVVTSGYGPRTAWHGCILMVWLNNSQDSMGTRCDVHTGIVRGPHGNLQCFSYPTGPVRDPQGYRTAHLRTRKGIDTTIIGKNPARASYLAVRGPYGPLTGCSRAVYDF